MNTKKIKILLMSLTTLSSSLTAELSLPSIFSDHAILLKSDNTPIWGKGRPGEAVSVTLGKLQENTIVAEDGKWSLHFDLSESEAGPFEMRIQGDTLITITDILVGEVWLASGQSNMEWPLKYSTGGKEIAQAVTGNEVREFKIKKHPSPELLDDVEGQWTVAAPDTLGNFSAIGYLFADKLNKALQQPIGIVNSTYGGTKLESWTSSAAMDTNPEIKAGKDRAQKNYHDNIQYVEDYAEWIESTGREDQATADTDTYASPDIDTSDWTTVSMPELFSHFQLPESGAIWIRKKILIDEEQSNKNLDIHLGDIQGANQVFWNGIPTGHSDSADVERRYSVNRKYLSPGEGVLAIRIFNPGYGIGIQPGKYRFRAGAFQLSGEWLAKVEYALPELDATAKADFPLPPEDVSYIPPHVASFLFNGMIHPIIPYGIRGIIWNQGTANWSQGYQYKTLFPIMIQDWRTRWGRGDIPFIYCQLQNHQRRFSEPGESWWAEVREGQDAALTLPNTYQTILLDIGEQDDIHYADKREVSARMALSALEHTYGHDVASESPVMKSVSVQGNQIRVEFAHAPGGLVAKELPSEYQLKSNSPKMAPLVRNAPDGELEGFAICGSDGKWHWATANIEGSSVILTSASVSEPKFVRYAWANNPITNLYNKAGLPAAPFRTDDFPLISRKNKY